MFSVDFISHMVTVTSGNGIRKLCLEIRKILLSSFFRLWPLGSDKDLKVPTWLVEQINDCRRE